MTFASLRDLVDALPEPERTSRRMLYSEDQWETAWELNAWQHQIPPLGDEWASWTVIGSRREGKTTAGYKWVEQKFLYGESSQILVVLRYQQEVDRITRMMRERLVSMGVEDQFEVQVSDRSLIRFTHKGSYPRRTLHIVVEQRVKDIRLPSNAYDYVWADEIEDAPMLMNKLPATKQFVFTQPTKLPEHTILSRAGNSRTL